MKKSELRKLIRESIRETINEGAMDSFVKMFDNLDVWADKVQAKHPDAIEKTKEALKKTGAAVGEELMKKVKEGLSLLNEKNTPEKRKKIITWTKNHWGTLTRITAMGAMQSMLSDSIEWASMGYFDGYMMEFLMLVISFAIVSVVANEMNKMNPFTKNENENTETEEIDFNMPLDLTGLLDSTE